MAKLFVQDLLQLSSQWLGDARTLFGAQRYPGAYYAGGVALECALKARIARFTEAGEFPDKKLAEKAWGHDPAMLLAVGDLARFMDQASPAVQMNWTSVKDWKVDSRYNHTMNLATVSAFLAALDDPKDGVLPWLLPHC